MKLFNGILGVFAIIASSYCFWFPGISFLNVGWMVTILLLGWGGCVLFEAGTNNSESKPDKMTRARGVVALSAGIVTCISAIIAEIMPVYAVVTDEIIICIFVVWIIISGLSSIITALSSIKKLPCSKWILKLVLGIITFLAGIYGICHVFLTAWTITLMIGSLLTVYGFRLLASVFE